MRRYLSLCCFLLCLVLIVLTLGVASSRTIEDILKLPEEEIDLAEAFLCLAQDFWQDVFGETFDVASYLKYIDEMALSLKKRIDESDSPEAAIASINEYLFGELGFKKISEGPEDIFLNSVIEKKGGNCVGLSILYLSLGERLGLPLYGVVMPGHFLVRYDDGQKRFNIEITLAGIFLPDEFYLEKCRTFLGNPLHFKNLTKKGTIGALLFDRGAAYQEKGLYDKAIADYTRAIKLNPKDADAYYDRGNAYYSQGIYDRAVADFTKAIELNPRDSDAYYNRGLAYAYQGIYDKAAADFTKVIELNPRDAEAYNNRGLVYDSQSLHDKAIADLTKAIELNPEYAEAYYNRGNVYAHQHLHKKAIADYTKAIELNPELTEAYYSRGLVYRYQGLHDKAIADLTKAIELNPEFAEAYYSLALTYERINRPEEALKAYEMFVRLASPRYKKYIGYILERIKSLKERLSRKDK